MLALRADMDALPMSEKSDIPHRTTTPYAHMCGHDGHITMLLLAAALITKHISKLPSNKKIRLLFQPAEEDPGGALPMIEEGCLNQVTEVYGCHNVPNFTAGQIRVIPGPTFAEYTEVTIRVYGKGGHGSAPH